ncbi:MAG: Mov34/MPN/PAD-1 family protein [Phycisphaerales bacterium]
MPHHKTRLARRDIRRMMSRAVARARGDWEICGLLIDNGCFLQMRETRNLSRRRGSCALDFREINAICRACERLDLKIVGTFHSHIRNIAKPGQTDIRGAEDGDLMLIIHFSNMLRGGFAGTGYRRREE